MSTLARGSNDMQGGVSERAESGRGWRFFQLFVLALAVAGASYGRFTLGPLQETIRASLNLTDNQIAMLQGPAVAIPMMLCSIPIGLYVDRYSRTRLIVVSAALNLFAIVVTAFASNITLLFASRSLSGLASAATGIAVISLVCDFYRPEQRGRALIVTGLGEASAAPLAFALGGALLVHGAAAQTGLENWRWALLWMCAPMLIVTLLMLVLREPARTDVKLIRPPIRDAWPQLWRYRSVLVPLLVARVMVWLADGAVLVWAAPSFARRYGLPPDSVGAIMATALLVCGLLGPVMGGLIADLSQRTGGPRRTMTVLCAMALLSLPAALFAIMPTPGWAGFMLVAFLTIGLLIGNASTAIATIVIPGELRGLYVAITITVGATFLIGVSPLAVSFLSVALGGPTMIDEALAMVCASTTTLAAIIFGLGRRHFPKIGNSVENLKTTSPT